MRVEKKSLVHTICACSVPRGNLETDGYYAVISFCPASYYLFVALVQSKMAVLLQGFGETSIARIPLRLPAYMLKKPSLGQKISYRRRSNYASLKKLKCKATIEIWSAKR